MSLGRPEASIFNGVGHLVLLVLPTFLRKTNRTKSSFQKKASIKKEKKSDFFSFFFVLEYNREVIIFSLS